VNLAEREESRRMRAEMDEVDNLFGRLERSESQRVRYDDSGW
jgi:hypothetical protein